MNLKINKVTFQNLHNERWAFYLTIVPIGINECAFWSQHKCSGMSDMQAETAFVNEHFLEVEELIRQKMRNEILVTN